MCKKERGGGGEEGKGAQLFRLNTIVLETRDEFAAAVALLVPTQNLMNWPHPKCKRNQVPERNAECQSVWDFHRASCFNTACLCFIEVLKDTLKLFSSGTGMRCDVCAFNCT